MTLKNQFVRLHRWFGLIMCLFFVAWFMSGFVMMYVDFPQYSKKNRLAHQPVLSLDSCLFIPARLSAVRSQDTAWKRIRLDMLLGRPVFRMETQKAELYSFYADNGTAVPQLSPDQARAVAMNYLSGVYSPLLIEQITELDQWIPRSAFIIDMHIYKLKMDDPDETVIYISSKTGEILQIHTWSQRILAWCGPIIHWIYPKELILRRPLWRVVVILVSSLGMVASITGIIAGLIRVKKKKSGSKGANFRYVSPYRKIWFRWHHYTGFIFGLIIFTWVFSGLLSMSPFGWSPQAEISEQENQRLQGGNLTTKSFTQAPREAFALLKNGFSAVEIEFKRFQGRNYYIASDAAGNTRISAADSAGVQPFRYFPQDMIIRAIQSVHPNDSPSQISLLDQEDSYYYSKHNDNPLPVLRIRYADAEKTWYYTDPSNGEIRLKNNASSRISRWLYNGLHSLDFFNLQHHRPVWDILIILLLTGGTAVSLTGLVLALKYIRRL
jgi:hypothetical protein